MPADKFVAYNTADDSVKVPVKVPAGNINVTLIVTPDPQFSRQDFDLTTALSLSGPELAAGCCPVVRTLSGKSLRLNVPAGTRAGTIFRLPAYGLPKPGGANGDLLVSVIVS